VPAGRATPRWPPSCAPPVGVYDGSDKEERLQLENIVRDHHLLSAKDISNALLEYAVKKDYRLGQIGEQDRIDDKTVFIIKRN
jgi:hypothetical protein